MKTPTYTIQHFDQMPDSARVRGFEFRTLLGIGNTTFYHRIATGAIPKPNKDKTWDAGTVRSTLRGASS